MRVVLVAEQLRRPVPGGIGTYVRGLVHGLEALGDDAPEVTLWASRPLRRGADPVAALGTTVVSTLPGAALVQAWDRGLAGFSGDTDLVHASSLAVPPRGPKPLAVTVHDLAWRRYPEAYPARGRRWHEAALARAIDRADLLVTPSRATADHVVGAGAAASCVEVVEEGSDHLPEPDDAGAASVLDGLGVTGPFLLSVCTLEPRKNLRRLVEAYQRARPRLPEPWPLVAVGPTGWGDDGPPSGDGVLLAGFVDDAVLAGLYRRGRALGYVPLLEGFGLPPLEAMAAGLPVVASPMPSTSGAALEVDPFDVDAIADALVTVTTDDAVRSDLVAAGAARAGALTWAATARAHLELWKGLVG